MFADLTLQVLPDVRIDNWCLLAVALASQPFLEATESNVAHRAGAFTGRDQLVVGHLLLRQADSTAEVLLAAFELEVYLLLFVHLLLVFLIQIAQIVLHLLVERVIG